MYYGENKVRQMARSILPSTRRKSARHNLRAIKQRHRALVRRELRLVDDEHETRDSFDTRSYPYGEIAYEVRERRDADKLGHFEKWAVEITKDIEEVDGRIAKMRAMLPQGLVGDHAMSHLENYDAFRPAHRVYRWYDRPLAERQAEAKASRVAEDARRARLLREVVETGWGHRMLNQSIRHATTTWSVWTKDVPTRVPDGVNGGYKTILRDCFVDVVKGPTSPRKLRGLGDVEDFVRDLRTAAFVRAVIDTGEHIVTREVRPCKRWYYGKPASVGEATYVVESFRSTRSNPARHPEWLQSVDEFLDKWATAQGDRGTLLAR